MNPVSIDKEAIQETLKKDKITDIFGFIKKQAKATPELVADPDTINRMRREAKAFEEKRAEALGDSILADFQDRAPEAIGTKRAELEEVLAEHGIGLADAYESLTDKQKAYGQITSRLSFASGVDEVEKIFTWAAIQFGEFSLREKCLAMFQGGELIGTGPANYRGIRKMYLEIVKGNKIEIKPEYLEAKDKREAVQKSVCAKLLKAKSPTELEDIFSWAEVELGKQIGIADRYIVFFQVAEMITYTDGIYRAMRKILVRMNKD
jgi:hypothetical protein